MAGVGEELFNRGKAGDDSDFLDDTALITAFDKAINPIKALLGDTQLTDAAKNRTSHVQKKKKKHKKNKNASRKRDTRDSQVNWHVGSRCRCTYSADGLIYDAVIISLADEDMCTVQYDYYNNEEQQRLRDLLPPSGDASDIPYNSSRMGSDLESADGIESRVESQSNDSMKAPHSTTNKQRCSKNQKTKKFPANRIPRYAPPSFPFSYAPSSFPHMPPLFPHAPPPFARMPPPFHPMPPPFHRSPGVPFIPPPPMMSDSELIDDKEALYSMLISWYMSGYHTGYYEGIKRRGQRRPEEDEDDDYSTTETASSSRRH